MRTFDVPIWVTINAETQETAWLDVFGIVNTVLSDAQEAGEIIRWESGEPQEDKEGEL